MDSGEASGRIGRPRAEGEAPAADGFTGALDLLGARLRSFGVKASRAKLEVLEREQHHQEMKVFVERNRRNVDRGRMGSLAKVQEEPQAAREEEQQWEERVRALRERIAAVAGGEGGHLAADGGCLQPQAYPVMGRAEGWRVLK